MTREKTIHLKHENQVNIKEMAYLNASLYISVISASLIRVENKIENSNKIILIRVIKKEKSTAMRIILNR